ncbi:permease of ABC transporter (plasmid) [Azospirillum sp. B510]|uniref:ABC transporter permease n=1 Tax=Azospirillum sp. (strain B510) TaxID=137722 RepID=UPI0001C4C864|nr:ABC transporter permease [Azospirillum sp. B510]BAI75638.1 permease of ABC transporter [Azospirillum sp. B510]
MRRVRPGEDGESGGRLWRALAADALRNLGAMRQRSLLALLGIAIGTAAVVALISIGENAREHSMRQFLAMGADILTVQKDFSLSSRPATLTRADVERLRTVPGIEEVAPVAMLGVEIRQGRTRLPSPVAGVTPELFALVQAKAAQGRTLTEQDRAETVVVLGAGLARRLAEDGQPPAPGGLLRMGGYNHTVVGVLADSVPNPVLPLDVNSTAFVPLSGARRVSVNSDITNLVVRKASSADDQAVRRSLIEEFSAGPRPRTVMVQSARQLIVAMTDQARVHTLLLAAIGGVSLIVGGVGVMNVMLMGVVERRREIGLRLALGARPIDVRAMFLAEALALSLCGGMVGVLLGLAAAALYAWNAGWAFAPSILSLPLGLGMSSGVGLFFGLYPAVQASRLEPVAALRGE